MRAVGAGSTWGLPNSRGFYPSAARWGGQIHGLMFGSIVGTVFSALGGILTWSCIKRLQAQRIWAG
eukprot:9515380-Lingulodinium_polyedra.AAC.1